MSRTLNNPAHLDTPQSMLNLIDKGGLKDAKGRTVFSYVHPIFWAPFSLVGDGGGGKPAG